MFPSFELFGHTFGMYSVVTLIGIILACVLVLFLTRKKGIIFDNILMAGLSSLGGMFIGGHFLFGLTRLTVFFKVLFDSNTRPNSFFDYLDLFSLTFGGMVFYGGLFGGIIGLCIYTRYTHKDTRLYLNAFTPAFSLIHAFGRIGCFFAGCCYGIEYHGPLHIDYPEIAIIGSANADIADFSRFPVPLLESLAEFMVCLFLVILFKKFGTKFSLLKVYLFTYSIVRFSDEFLRGDKIRGFWGPFSTSQWISIFIILIITVMFFKDKFFKKQNRKEKPL